MNAPSTEPRKTIRVGGERLWWLSPGYVGSLSDAGAPTNEAATVTYRPTTGNESSALALAWQTLTVTAQPSRDTLTATLNFDPSRGVLPFGDGWLWTEYNGAIPVRITRVEAGVALTIHLADRIGDLDLTAGGYLQSALWYVDESAAAVVDAVTRTASGDFPIPYTVNWSLLQPANPGGVGAIPGADYRTESTLSVVRQPFRTGLTTQGIQARYPELVRMAQAGSAGLEAAIFAEHQALYYAVTAAVREAGAPGYTWADDVDAGPFVECHAAYAAARVVRSVRPEQAQTYREDGDRLFAQALSIAWTDLNRDGVVDAGESPGLVGFATSAQAVPAVVPTRTAWWSLGERR